jgi:hypothetical protein
MNLVRRVALVSCVKSKRSSPAPAGELYTSALFTRLRAYALANADTWYILSAEHGLLHPEQVIAPYEKTLNTMRKSARAMWAARVQRQLLEALPPGAEVVILAGERYRADLVPFLSEHGFSVRVPLQGLSFGRQLQHLNNLEARDDAADHLNRFYALLEGLERLPAQGVSLAELRADTLPERGVYFFREPGEVRAADASVLRVVRVGTHAVSAGSRATLYARLRQHRGQMDGGGNHRGSVFRRHVGAALLSRWDVAREGLEHWGADADPTHLRGVAEHAHEQRVSRYLGRMRVEWVEIPDEPGRQSLRAYIERNSIALLSNGRSPLDPPSAEWLGHYSPAQAIVESGLWNVRHVDDRYDPGFLDVLSSLVGAVRTGTRVPVSAYLGGAPTRKAARRRATPSPPSADAEKEQPSAASPPSLSSHSRACERLHQLSSGLPRFRFPPDPARFPRNGLTLLFEEGETAHGVDRVVWVGSHTTPDGLFSRLRNHVRPHKDGSILRKTIGAALLAKRADPFLEVWQGRASGNAEAKHQAEVEAEVSAYIHQRLSFAILPLTNRRDREYFQSRLVALLAVCPACRPSSAWLGNDSPKQKVRASGLWQEQHTGGAPASEAEIGDLLRQLGLKGESDSS